MTPRDLQRQAVKDARLQEAMTQAFAEELAGVLRRATREVRRIVRALNAEAGRLVRNRSNLARVVQVRDELHRALVNAGYHDLAQKAMDAPLDRLAAAVLRGAEEAVTLTSVDIASIQAFKQLRLAELFDFGSDVAGQLWRTTLDGVLGVRPVDDLVADLEVLLDESAPVARTIYDTAVSTYSRQVDQLHTTGEPDELFLYAGPNDLKTREFCKARVGEVFTREEIDAMDNGQLPNVMLTGGGYNCRHQWKRVSLLDEELRDRFADRKQAA